MKNIRNTEPKIEGKFVNLEGERFYKIKNVDHMAPFFISVVSSSDHWLFISSTGSLSAGRIRPENALFPYKSVDHIHESAENTGSKSIYRIAHEGKAMLWEPFNVFHDGLYDIERNLYKNITGDKVIFEEINTSLKIKFQYNWSTSERYGFIRESKLTDLSGSERSIELLDGIQNILPPGAPLSALQTKSALVDAYKWNEKVTDSSLALFSMYARLSDRADPAESLLATTVFSVDNDINKILLSSAQVNAFRKGVKIEDEPLVKGLRGSYLIHKSITLSANQTKEWSIIADIDKTHADISHLQTELSQPLTLKKNILKGIEENKQELISLMSGADAWQLTSDEATSVHHYANVLFNNMRGGIFDNGYWLEKSDVIKTMRHSNSQIVARHKAFLEELGDTFTHAELINKAKTTADAQLVRLCYEYLPLTFGRRHGDPSRPWNHYEIKLKDDNGDRLLSYQGNWRDIFQNWEAIAQSYPKYITSFISKFVNASTIDGYNPYRITKEGVDWELMDQEDPWSNIGYWGDHQIIYLLKFLELADKFEHDSLAELLRSDIFSYANVPYELCGVERLFDNPKDTVDFNHDLQKLTEQRTANIGSDGRLLMDRDNEVYLVNLMEKILVPLLAKLSNLVIDGGIWLNTQRPEWNDANNAIVGNGLSMVTLCYMRRYIDFVWQLLDSQSGSFAMSIEVTQWLRATTQILSDASCDMAKNNVTNQQRHFVLNRLAEAAEQYRSEVYAANGFSGKTDVALTEIKELMSVSLSLLNSSIENNLREDGLYNAYNILSCEKDSLAIEELYPMLEGQVAVLSAGTLSPKQAVSLLDYLFASDMYREDQDSFMLYPDRDLSSFLARNTIAEVDVINNPVLKVMTDNDDRRLISKGIDGQYHFNANFENNSFLKQTIDEIKHDYGLFTNDNWEQIIELYENVFNHKEFTGRSGTMFGYEGLGCIYWHMVSKLLLAVQENYHKSRELDPNSEETKALADYYYRVRGGIGFNKSPENYGAFPTDPYSHTPKHSGAQQPGMTGQVKEEVITRFSELGIRVSNGKLSIEPSLLESKEFLTKPSCFNYLNINGDDIAIALDAQQLAFTYCQTPFVYNMTKEESGITAYMNDGTCLKIPNFSLDAELSSALFNRTGEVLKIEVLVPRELLR